MTWEDTVERIKDALSWVGLILLAILFVAALIGVTIGVKYLYAWVAEQLGIPYIWVI